MDFVTRINLPKEPYFDAGRNLLSLSIRIFDNQYVYINIKKVG